MIWLEQSLESPEVLAGKSYVRNPSGLCVLEALQRAERWPPVSWCGGWCFVAFQWICGSIPSGVIRGTQMKFSGKALSLTAAMCVCLFSFTSRPFHPSLTILDLIIRYDAKVKICLCFEGRDTVKGLKHFLWLCLALDGVIDPATMRGNTLHSPFSQFPFYAVLLCLVRMKFLVQLWKR